MTNVYFVRHAQPLFSHAHDLTRPLTEEGMKDAGIVLSHLKDKEIDVFYCSPYKRSVDTIRETAEYYGMEINKDVRFREREKGPDSNNHSMFRKRWEDHSFAEEGGESIQVVQDRNIEALHEVLRKHEGENIVIGTHGTALSTILNYYNPDFGCDDFLRIIDWMPYILAAEFDGVNLVSMKEIAYIEKIFDPNK